MTQSPSFDLAVIGGGLAGLAAATFAARAGFSVLVFERAPQPGGRASTQSRDGYLFNQGPHALYCSGHGVKVLRELGISWRGAAPTPGGSWALYQGQKYPLPRTPEALLGSEFLPREAALEVASLFGQLTRQFDTAPWDRTSWREWLNSQVKHAESRALFEGLLRLSTYCNEDDAQSAGGALAQFVVGGDGVEYLDGGWQTLVDSLRDAAEKVGVRIASHSGVEEIRCENSGATIRLANGQTHTVRAVISTIAPSALAAVMKGGEFAPLRQWADEAIPIHAACLDIALRRLPNPENQFAIGLDRPLYYSVHTRSARLAPAGGEVIQLAKYLPSGSEESGAQLEQELEALMDEMQPGWRGELVAKRFLPRMLVANAVVTAKQGGTSGRPGPAVPGFPNLFVAGDWVGPHGMLVDASLSSAKDAAALALRWLESVRNEPLREEFAVMD